MNRVIQVQLSASGLRDLNKQIRQYKNVTIPTKLQEFVSELADVGIAIARVNTGEFKPYLGFVKEIRDTKYSYQSKALVVGFNEVPNVAKWWKKGQIKEADVNSLMMAEYGSGKYAIYGYRGTFPNDEGRKSHGLDDSGWFWTPVGGNGTYEVLWSDGVEPSRPMYHAWVGMKLQIEMIARRVFDRS